MKHAQSPSICMVLSLLFFVSPAWAHFGMVIPSDSMVMPEDSRTVEFTLSFSHPFEQVGMPLEKPVRFAVTAQGETSDLTGRLEPANVMGNSAWRMNFQIIRPGVYIFTMTPKPYWEPAEDRFIIHYTKTVVTAFGDDSGWDAEAGLPAEIIPLARPFGLWTGNVFQGTVKCEGKPVPNAEVEVEYLNTGNKVKVPNDYMICQTVKADEHGIFTYAAPAAGWWGFCALTTAGYKMEKEGKKKDVELGAVIWVQFLDWDHKPVSGKEGEQ